MTIDLKPEQQRVIDLAVQSGAYLDPGEVLDQAFEIIREQLDLEDWMLANASKWPPTSRPASRKPSVAN